MFVMRYFGHVIWARDVDNLVINEKGLVEKQ